MVECFVGYLDGHNRPIHEVLFSRDQDLATAFENEFQGIACTPVSLTALVETRQRLRRELQATLTSSHRAFLLGLVPGPPRWELMQCGHLVELSAIRWKMQKLAKLKRSSPRKPAQQADELRARFGASKRTPKRLNLVWYRVSWFTISMK